MNKLTHDAYEIHSEAASLQNLATTLSDVIRGYDQILSRAAPDLVAPVQALRDRHERDAAEILTLLGAAGDAPDEPGSLMGAVHEAVVTARDWLGALDRDALDAILEGEERVLDHYAATLAETYEKPELHDLVAAQQQALETHLRTLQQRRD